MWAEEWEEAPFPQNQTINCYYYCCYLNHILLLSLFLIHNSYYHCLCSTVYCYSLFLYLLLPLLPSYTHLFLTAITLCHSLSLFHILPLSLFLIHISYYHCLCSTVYCYSLFLYILLPLLLTYTHLFLTATTLYHSLSLFLLLTPHCTLLLLIIIITATFTSSPHILIPY